MAITFVFARRLEANVPVVLAIVGAGSLLAALPVLAILSLANDCQGISSFPLPGASCAE